MPDSREAVFTKAIQSLANVTAAATASGNHRVADASIELQYVISSRIRPWLTTDDIPTSTYVALEYTVKGFEAQVGLHAPITDKFAGLRECEVALKRAGTSVEKTLCLITYAASIAEHFDGAA